MKRYIFNSEFLKALRVNRSLKQSDMVHYVGISQTNYSRLESGGSCSPSCQNLFRLCDFFEVEPRDFFISVPAERFPLG